MFEPMYSPWGNIQTCKILMPGVFEVATASHGGIMVSRDCISETLSREAQKCGFMDGAYIVPYPEKRVVWSNIDLDIND